MDSLALGVAAALASSMLYNLGVALQALEAREAPLAESLRPSLLKRLALRPRWLLGTLCVLAGWALQAASLLLAPLTVVQPTLALGLVVLLPIGVRLLGETVGRREVRAVLAMVAGVTGLAVAAPPQTDEHAGPLALTLGLTAFALVALAPYLLNLRRRQLQPLVVLSSGLAYAWCGLSTKFVADGLASGSVVAVGLWAAATAAAAGVGLLSEMTALQRGSAIRVFPVVLVIQIVVAVLGAPLLAGESWSAAPLASWMLPLSLVVLATGTATLAAAPAVGGVVAEGSASPGRRRRS